MIDLNALLDLDFEGVFERTEREKAADRRQATENSVEKAGPPTDVFDPVDIRIAAARGDERETNLEAFRSLDELDPDYDTDAEWAEDPGEYDDRAVADAVEAGNRLVHNLGLEVTTDELLTQLAEEYLAVTRPLSPKPNEVERVDSQGNSVVNPGHNVVLESEETVAHIGMEGAFDRVLGSEFVEYLNGSVDEVPQDVTFQTDSTPEPEQDDDRTGPDKSKYIAAVMGTIGLTALGGCMGGDGSSTPTETTTTSLQTSDTPDPTATLAETDTTIAQNQDSDGDGVSDPVEEELGLNPNDSSTIGDIPDEEVVEYDIPVEEAKDDQAFQDVYTALESEDVKQELVNETYGEDVDEEFLQVLSILSETPSDIRGEAVTQVLEAEDTETAYKNVEVLDRLSDEEIREAIEIGLSKEHWDDDIVSNYKERYADPLSKNSDDDMLNDTEEELAGTVPTSKDTNVIQQMRELGIQEVTEENAEKVRDPDGDSLITAYEIQIVGTDPNDANSDGDLLGDRQEWENEETDPTKPTMVIGYATDGANWFDNPEVREFIKEKMDKFGYEETLLVYAGEVEIDGENNINNYRDELPEQYEEVGYPLVIFDDPRENDKEKSVPHYAGPESNVAVVTDYSEMDTWDKKHVLINEVTGTASSTELPDLEVPEHHIEKFLDEYTTGDIGEEDEQGRLIVVETDSYSGAREPMTG